MYIFSFYSLLMILWFYILLHATLEYFNSRKNLVLLRTLFLVLIFFAVRFLIMYTAIWSELAFEKGYIEAASLLMNLVVHKLEIMKYIDAIVTLSIFLVVLMGWFKHQRVHIEDTLEYHQLLQEDADYLAQESSLQSDLIHLHELTSEIKNLLIETSSQDKMLNELCHILSVYRHYKVVWIGLHNEDSNDVDVAYKVDLAEPAYFSNDFKVNLKHNDKHALGPVGECLSTHKTVHVTNTQTDARFEPWRSRAKFSKIGSVISIPIKRYHEEELFGALSVYSEMGHKISAQEIAILEDIVVSVSSAVAFHEADNLRKATQRQLEASTQMLKNIVSTVPVRVFWKNSDLKYLGCNELFAQDAGVSHVEDIIGKQDSQLKWKAHAKEYVSDDSHVINTKKPIINRIERQGDMWLLTNKAPLLDNENNVIGVVGSYTDITYQKQAEIYIKENEHRFRELLNALPNISVQGYDENRTIIYWNKQSEVLYGYSEREALGQKLEDLIIPKEMRNGVIAAVDNWIVNHEPIKNGELTLQKKDGSKVDVYSSHVLLRSKSNKPELFCVDIDLTQQKEIQRRMKFLANYDSLTQLPNRHYFHTHLQAIFNKAKRNNSQFAVFFIDLDDFKLVNDNYGHEYGDLVLKESAARFKKILRDYDFVARYGGDEFVVCIEHEGKKELLSQIASKIVKSIKQPYVFEDKKMQIGSSVGISCYPKDGDAIHGLLKCADTAMYAAKNRGKNQFSFCN